MKRSIPWLTALLQIAILFAVIALAAPWWIAATSPLPTPRRTGDITLRGHQARPIFSGSVVPGGVYTPDELRRAIERDPVVAAHYRQVNLDEMEAVTLTTGRAAYVSYRRDGRVYWTRQRVWLNAGETVLTDGTTTIRARCGNCVSNVSRDDFAAVDPAHGELDESVVPPTADPGVDGGAPDVEARLGTLLQVPFAPGAFGTLTAPPPLEGPPGGWGFPLVPPVVVPGGGTLGGLGPGVTVPPPRPPRDDPPPVPPVVFVPPGGGPGGPAPGTGNTGTTGGAGDSTGGTTGDVTTGDLATTGGTTGSPTDTGMLTDGSVLPTTTDTGTSSGATGAPEPGLLWLMAAGVIGLARRKLRVPGSGPRTKN